MYKIYYFILLLSLPFCANAQNEEPLRVIFKYYYGGDYRNDTLRGSYELVDKVIYKKESDRYVLDSVTHIEKVFRNGYPDFILDDKSEPKEYDTQIRDFELSPLLEHLDTADYKYTNTTKIDTFGEVHHRNYYTPKDFSLVYYDIDTAFFQCFCQFYEKKLRKKADEHKSEYTGRGCNDKIDFKNFIEDLFELENTHITLSSYLICFSIKLEYKSNVIELLQINPYNRTAWRVYYKDSEKSINLINPKINDAVMKILPKRSWRRNFDFDKYKDMERLYNLYLERY